MKKRRIILAIEDVGDDRFSFKMEGDCERIGSKEVGLEATPAEFWAIQFWEACQARLRQGNEVKPLNREERRKG